MNHDIMLLKVGRHLRPNPRMKLIIGREEGENKYMEGYRNTFLSILPTSHMGPLALIDGTPTDADVQYAAQIVARYSQGRLAEQVELQVRFPDGQTKQLQVTPLSEADIDKAWHV